MIGKTADNQPIPIGASLDQIWSLETRERPEGTWRSPLSCPGTTEWWGWPDRCASSCVPKHQTWHDRAPERRVAAMLHIVITQPW